MSPVALQRFFLLAWAFLVLGCCAEPELVGVRFEQRFEVQTRPRVAVLSVVLEGDPVWAYGEPPASIARVSSHYRVGKGDRVGGPEEAPPLVQRALRSAQKHLAERGYRPASGEEPPQAYVSLSLGTRAGRLVRVGLHVGGEHEGAFLPRAVSLVVAEGEDEDPCPIELEATIRDLVFALPPADPGAETQ